MSTLSGGAKMSLSVLRKRDFAGKPPHTEIEYTRISAFKLEGRCCGEERREARSMLDIASP